MNTVIDIVGVSFVFLLIFYMTFPQVWEFCENIGSVFVDIAQSVTNGFIKQAGKWKELFSKLTGGNR